MPKRANPRCDPRGGLWESRGGEWHPTVGPGVVWRSPLARVIVASVREYQRIAPTGLRASCRYTPTCSEYAITSIERYGALVGGVRSVRRILRCRQPFGGIDEA